MERWYEQGEGRYLNKEKNLMMKYCLILFFLVFFAFFLQAQEVTNSSYVKLPSLEEVLQIAMENSPLLKQKETEVKIKEKDLLIQKREWMKYLYVEGSLKYGLYDAYIMQDNSDEINSVYGMLSQTKQTSYYTGIGFKLPFSALTNRKRELDLKKLEVEKADYEKEMSEEEVSALIIEKYFQLKYLDESMRNYFEILQSLEISYNKSKMDLYNGRTDLNDFAVLSSSYGKARNEYLKMRNTFWSEYYIFKNITGIELKPNMPK